VRGSVKNGGRACKPDSVSRTLLPQSTGSDHSSSPGLATGIQRPTRGLMSARFLAQAMACATSGWESPPLLFGLAPRGVCLASDIAAGPVGSYPTFSPLPIATGESITGSRFPARWSQFHSRRRYVLCGTFRDRASPRSPQALPGAFPFCPQRPAFARRFELRSPDFPPACLRRTGARSSAHCRPAIARPARQ